MPADMDVDDRPDRRGAAVPVIRPSVLRHALTRAAAVLLAAGVLAGTALVSPAAATAPPAPSLRVIGSGAASSLQWSESVAVDSYVVIQATNSALTHNVKTYQVRYRGRALTPFGLAAGTTYWFAVRAVRSGVKSARSNKVSYVGSSRHSVVKVLSYNSASASFDGRSAPGGVQPPWKDRRPGQLSFINNSGADVVGIQEGSACIVKIQSKPCYRQIDSIADGTPGYTLVTTWSTNTERYHGNYILYRNTVSPVGGGGTWDIGDSSLHRYAAYQLFTVAATGAEFLFVSTHLMNGGTSYDDDRKLETTNLLSIAGNYAQQHGVTSIVYVGDFNTYVGEKRINDRSGPVLISHHVADGIKVARYLHRAGYSSINSFWRVPPQHGSADHVYATGGVAVKTWGELLNLHDGAFAGTIPSDHNPVYAVLTLPY
jgi:endonuclease/exonuclease/phosphatase family metal-dependent hydrolase